MISATVDTQGKLSHQQTDEPVLTPVLVPGGKTGLSAPRQNPNRKKVLFVTSEIADLVKTGGLGDVSAALPRARVRKAKSAR